MGTHLCRNEYTIHNSKHIDIDISDLQTLWQNICMCICVFALHFRIN